MFEYFNNILCVNGAWLYENGQIMSKANYKQLKLRQFTTIRRGGNGRTALISYESIPERFKTLIIEKCGDPYKITKNNKFKDYLEQDAKAVEYFNNYTLDSGEALPEKNKKEYIANASVLNAIDLIITNRTAKSKALGGKSSRIWERMAEIIQELPKHTYPHTLPRNVRRLKEKYKTYKAEGYEILIHKGFCNKNSEKINDDAKIWVLSRWADQINKCASIHQLFHEYNAKAKDLGWKKLEKDVTIRNYLNQEEIKHLWYGHRYGEKKAKEKFTYHLSTKLPSMRDSLWYSDGTKLNYFYLDDNGKVATCQVYEVMDAFSEVLLGFHISKTEDFEAQFRAYRMAVKTAGHRPYQLGFDNQGGHKKLENGEFLTKLARLSIKAQPYNGKSKTIESAFGRFQQQFLKQDWFFSGMNITTKRAESKANLEFINANKHNLPTLPEVIETYIKRRQQWNEATHYMSGMQRIEMYRSSENPKAPEIQAMEMVDLFWILRDKPVMYSAYGLTFKHKDVKYTYSKYTIEGLPDMQWHKKNIDKKFFIKFDPEDMDMIYIYEKDALGLRFVTELTTKTEVHRGKQEQEEWEAEHITKVINVNKASRLESYEAMQGIQEDFGRLPEQNGLNSQKLAGINSKRKAKPTKKRKVLDTVDVDKTISNMTPVMDGDEESNIYQMI